MACNTLLLTTEPSSAGSRECRTCEFQCQCLLKYIIYLVWVFGLANIWHYFFKSAQGTARHPLLMLWVNIVFCPVVKICDNDTKLLNCDILVWRNHWCGFLLFNKGWKPKYTFTDGSCCIGPQLPSCSHAACWEALNIMKRYHTGGHGHGGKEQ